MKQRTLDIQRQHSLYEFLPNDEICVYCGEFADCKDHFLPISKAVMMSESMDISSGRYLLPSCMECNSLAGDKVFSTVNNKRDYVFGQLKGKYYGFGNFLPEELSEFGYNLRTAILGDMRNKRRLDWRLKWINEKNVNVLIAEINFEPIATGKLSADGGVNSNIIRRSEKDLLNLPELTQTVKSTRILKKVNWTKSDEEFYHNVLEEFGPEEAKRIIEATKPSERETYE